MMQMRTHTCGELRLTDAGKHVKIVGWMENVRVVGQNFAFVVLRDFYGTTQVVIESQEMMDVINGLNKESTISVDGALLWLDMIGNRIAPIAFGPRKVLLVVGRNKITPTREAAEERIRTIAAPQNIARHPGFRTPCAVTGVCADCYSEDRICNTHLRMERCFPRKRITVVLIDEDLGL